MSINENILSEISDDEAMAVLSSLSFVVGDWATLQKLGGPKNVLASGIADERIKTRRFVRDAFCDLRGKFDRWYQLGGFLITLITHASARLFRARAAPLAFFGRCNPELIYAKPMVAVVGSRDASAQGCADAKALTKIFARYGITTVSGGARGIDMAAHEGALASGGTTVMISGTAVNFAKCGVEKDIFAEASDDSAVLYPYGPFLSQDKFMFVERNRFVAAMADAVIVMEGKERSGTLHTARFAEELRVPIFCRRVSDKNDPLSFAPQHLIDSGKARVLSDMEQFARTLMPKPLASLKNLMPRQRNKLSLAKSSQPLPFLLQVINDHESCLGFDDLLKVTGLPFTQLQKELLDYELDGRIFKQGAQFVLMRD